MKVAIITANTDIYKGTKANESGEAVKLVAEEAGLEVVFMRALPLDREVLSAIMKRLADGKAADLILTTGGAGCNPDDCTPGAIMATRARIVSYGAPVLPGAMMLVSYYTNEEDGRIIPILGLPGCVMYAKRTIFDLVLPRVMADDEITAEDIANLGEGGLCLNCDVCTFPNCGFGK